MGYIKILKQPENKYKMPIYKDGKYTWQEFEINEIIRPPIIRVPEYKKKFNRITNSI